MKTIRLPNSYKKMYDEDMRKIVEGSNIVNIGKVIVAAAVGLIGIFAVSTFNTDYILVKEEDFDRSLEVLMSEGYTVG